MKNKKHLLETIHHFIVGFFLTLKGVDKVLHHPVIGGLILAFGIILLFYFVYDLRGKRESSFLAILAHFFEAVALFLITVLYFKDGKTYLPYFTLIASIAFFISAIVLWRKSRRSVH